MANKLKTQFIEIRNQPWINRNLSHQTGTRILLWQRNCLCDLTIEQHLQVRQLRHQGGGKREIQLEFDVRHNLISRNTERNAVYRVNAPQLKRVIDSKLFERESISSKWHTWKSIGKNRRRGSLHDINGGKFWGPIFLGPHIGHKRWTEHRHTQKRCSQKLEFEHVTP